MTLPLLVTRKFMVPSPVAPSNLPVPPANRNLPDMIVLSCGKLAVRSPAAKFSLHLIKMVFPIPSVRDPPDLPALQSVILQQHTSLIWKYPISLSVPDPVCTIWETVQLSKVYVCLSSIIFLEYVASEIRMETGIPKEQVKWIWVGGLIG